MVKKSKKDNNVPPVKPQPKVALVKRAVKKRVAVSDDEPVEPEVEQNIIACLLYTSPSPRDRQKSRMPSSA